MSRHKLVKALDLEEELDDFDGNYDDGYQEQEDISAEDKSAFLPRLFGPRRQQELIERSEQLREGTVKVRAILGTGVPVTDREIEESLWHYYYDVEKTVNYLLSTATRFLQAFGSCLCDQDQQAKATAKPTNKQTEAPNPNLANGSRMSSQPSEAILSCSARFSATEFFKDCSWLNVPEVRQGEILIEPLYPRGGLLGGPPSQANGKSSKLAALAAARRQKENTKPSEGNMNSSVALLDKLGRKGAPPAPSRIASGQDKAPVLKDVPPPITSPARRKYPSQRRTSVGEARSESKSTELEPPELIMEDPKKSDEPPFVPAASPSAFARTMFGLPTAPNPNLDHPALPKESSHRSYNLSYALPYHLMMDTESNAFTGPSPDDVVLKAQNSKAQNSKGQKGAKPDNTKTVNGVTKAVENVSIIETPKPRSKNLNVLAELEKTKQKPAANFVVIGHVDAGKSTLMGRLLYDLKIVDQRTLERYRKEAESIGKSSFALAWVLDQGTDERSQGVTIDIGMNKFETDKTAFTILDAPGHRDFIPNMIAGASQADFAVLVIDASTGGFESGLKGQTKEHALLVRSMGVQRIIVAVNKLDTLSWSKPRFDEIQQQVSAFLTAAGFQPRNLAFLPCSGLTGDNVVRKVADPKASWYSGPPLISLLESSEPFARALEKPLRLTIDDVFRGGVQNPLSISGRLDAGSIQVGDVVVAVPSSESASIKGIEVDSEPRDWAVAGQNVILHLADIDQKHLRMGDVICPPSSPVKAVKSFTVKVLAFEHLLPMAVEVHRGRLHAPGRISRLVAVLDKSTGQSVEGARKKVKIVKPGSVARVVVEVEEAVPLEVGGRVVLRAGGETVGAGLLE